jgi:hypothetical protein
MTDERNNGLHPRHPGIGCSTSLIALEGDETEVGGFAIFFPSGRTKFVNWRSLKPITPTLDACKDYTAKVIDGLLNGDEVAMKDMEATNWVSVAAAVQRTILDFNTRVTKAINTRMAGQLILPGTTSKRPR